MASLNPTSSPSPKSAPTDPTIPEPPTSAAQSDNQPGRIAFSLSGSAATASAGEAHDVRRPSVQFALSGVQTPATGRAGSKPPRPGSQRRVSSPPPPPVFRPRVSFDTFDAPPKEKEDYSFSVSAKHKDYEFSKGSRTFLCGLDSNDYSEYALEWLIEELVDDGDEIVCLRVVDKDSPIAAHASVDQRKYRDEAEALLNSILQKNAENKALSLKLEFSVGKIQKVLEDMIRLYEPSMLIVGTRGRSLGGFQGLLPGSVSKYCLQHSPVPVIVVRPTQKRSKTKKKREVDPSRHGYLDILDKSKAQGAPIMYPNDSGSLFPNDQLATEGEAAAVAAALGFRAPTSSSPLAQEEPSEQTVEVDEPGQRGYEGESSPESMRSPGVVMKSPELRDLESPVMSEDEESDEEGGAALEESTELPNYRNADLNEHDTSKVNTLVGSSANSTTGAGMKIAQAENIRPADVAADTKKAEGEQDKQENSIPAG